MEENQNFEGEVKMNVVSQEEQSAPEQEQAVLDQAVEQGEIQPESAGVSTGEDGTIQINLDELKQPEENAIQDGETTQVSVDEQPAVSEEVVEEVQADTTVEDSPLELIQDEVPEVQSEDDGKLPLQVEQPVEDKIELPENVEKLVKFMEETGGSLEDYVGLNQDVDALDPVAAVKEYYKKTKPYLTDDQIQRQLNKKFYFDAEMDDPGDIEDKKIAFQEELFKAKEHISGAKEKYYADLKLNQQKQLPEEAQEALSFYKEHSETLKRQESINTEFKQKTEEVFSNEFKGFDFNVGENKYRFKVGDVNTVKESQSNLDNFIGQYISEDGTITNAAGYHRAIFAAQNADKLAQHFYEQGRAEAIKQQAKEANNINMNPRKDSSSVSTPSGSNVKVVSGNSMDKLRVRWNK